MIVNWDFSQWISHLEGWVMGVEGDFDFILKSLVPWREDRVLHLWVSE